MTKIEDKAIDDKADENVNFLALDPAKAIDFLQVVTKEGDEQATAALAKIASDAQDAGRRLKLIVENTKANRDEMSTKTVAALRASAEADVSHLKALVSAKLPSEVVGLQSSFLRKRMEMWVEQGREFQVLISRALFPGIHR